LSSSSPFHHQQSRAFSAKTLSKTKFGQRRALYKAGGTFPPRNVQVPWADKTDEQKQRAEHFRRKPNLFELIESLPSASHRMADPRDTTDPIFENKNGRGMKFFRDGWKSELPMYWQVTRCRPAQHGKRPQLWGIKTKHGVTESRPRKIRKIVCKRGWRFIPEQHLPIMQHFQSNSIDYDRVCRVMYTNWSVNDKRLGVQLETEAVPEPAAEEEASGEGADADAEAEGEKKSV
jgi:hypothetical protein